MYIRLSRAHCLQIGSVVFVIQTLSSCSLMEKSMQKSEREPVLAESKPSTKAPPPMDLKALERRLETKKEKEQYSKILPWLKNDEERLELLSLPNLEKRNQWIIDHKIYSRQSFPSSGVKNLISNQDISIGMPVDFVLKAWGEPTAKEISGNPLNRNERWKYLRTISAQEGYRQEKRTVYFEAGKVVGWETE